MDPITASLAGLGAVAGLRNLSARQRQMPIAAGSKNINAPMPSQDPLSRLTNIGGLIGTANNFANQASQKPQPQNSGINNSQTYDYVKPETAIDRRMVASNEIGNHEQMLNTFRDAEIQLNNLPPEQKMIHGPPLFQTIMAYHNDYKSGRVG